MSLCVVGIGGCGGKVAENFLESQDIGDPLGDYTTFGGIKGMWLEADGGEIGKQRFFLPPSNLRNSYRPFYFIPHQVIDSESDISKKVREMYGYDLKKDGFVRKAEYQKAIFEIFDCNEEIRNLSKINLGFDNPILREAWNGIRPFTTVAKAEGEATKDLCDGVLFIVSLGGGTGTGFINPITKYIREERSAFPVFVIGVLTEEGEDPQQGIKEDQRDLAATISIYDLLVNSQGIDGLIFIDNQILMDRFGKGNYPAIDNFIFESMKPLLASRNYPGEDPTSQALRDILGKDLDPKLPPVLVPCFSRSKKHNERDLIEDALKNGKLFVCEPSFSDRAIIFARGFLDVDKLSNALLEIANLKNDNVTTWRKLGDSCRNEVLVLLRNPYGFKDAYATKGTLEHRIHGIIKMALQYLHDKESEIIPASMPDDTKVALGTYFYGSEWVDKKIDELEKKIPMLKGKVLYENLAFREKLDKVKLEFSSKEDKPLFLVEELEKSLGRLKKGKTPIFQNELNIFKNEMAKPEEKKQVPKEEVEDRLKRIEKILNEKGWLAEIQ